MLVNEFLQNYGGVINNSLWKVLNADNANTDNNELENILQNNKMSFNILSSNIESIYSKFSEIEIFNDICGVDTFNCNWFLRFGTDYISVDNNLNIKTEPSN